jgi:hypothetical protein
MLPHVSRCCVSFTLEAREIRLMGYVMHWFVAPCTPVFCFYPPLRQYVI